MNHSFAIDDACMGWGGQQKSLRSRPFLPRFYLAASPSYWDIIATIISEQEMVIVCMWVEVLLLNVVQCGTARLAHSYVWALNGLSVLEYTRMECHLVKSYVIQH